MAKRYLKRVGNIGDYNALIEGQAVSGDTIDITNHVVLIKQSDIDNPIIKFSSDLEKNNENEYEFVDLGLPSGTLWAKKNIGAENEYDCGLIFAWGETEGVGHTAFSENTSGFMIGTTSVSFTQNNYNNASSYYLNSDATDLVEGHDAGAVLNSNWRMPTKSDCDELMSAVNCIYTQENTIAGWKLTNKKDATKYIFIPECFVENDTVFLGTSEDEYRQMIWTRSGKKEDNTFKPYYLTSEDTNGLNCELGTDYYGLPIRCVKKNK